ncbi:MAG: sigma-70 family RNA polymerase sigma factor [Anaerolineales bacterium]|nr:sigma-70 family RNA polymerase sigma factor [Anaerolineales bacterium]
MARPDKTAPRSQVFSRLVAKASQQGYLSIEDILEIYPAASKNKDQLALLVEALQFQGVAILEQEADEQATPLQEVEEKDPGQLEYTTGDDAVTLYLKEMSLTPLLTVEEELALAKRIARASQARDELVRLNGQNPERRLELEALVKDGQIAREFLIKANTRLVVSVARRYVGRGVPFLDLIQEGNLGLMKAVDKFEYQRGFRFSTYATWWIRQGIIRSIADQGRTIRVPVHMVDRLRQVYKVSQEMEQQLGRVPTVEELAGRLDLEISKLRWMLQVALTPLSLETPVGEDEEAELGMYVEDIASPSPAQMAYENILRERVEQVLATLSPREARVLRLRFGLGQDRPYTLEEVGQKFGLTRERIRQIEGKALRRLRQPGKARLLREYS